MSSLTLTPLRRSAASAHLCVACAAEITVLFANATPSCEGCGAAPVGACAPRDQTTDPVRVSHRWLCEGCLPRYF